MCVLFSRCGYHQTLLGTVFKKCCISNTMDETDVTLCNDSEEEGNVRSECGGDEGTD